MGKRNQKWNHISRSLEKRRFLILKEGGKLWSQRISWRKKTKVLKLWAYTCLIKKTLEMRCLLKWSGTIQEAHHTKTFENITQVGRRKRRFTDYMIYRLMKRKELIKLRYSIWTILMRIWHNLGKDSVRFCLSRICRPSGKRTNRGGVRYEEKKTIYGNKEVLKRWKRCVNLFENPFTIEEKKLYEFNKVTTTMIHGKTRRHCEFGVSVIAGKVL